MKLYLGFYAVNYFNEATPLAEWFDDAEWSETVLPGVEGLASAARALGFSGLAVDQELYAQEGGRKSATWVWDYPGNELAEHVVRSQVRRRGQEVMRTIVGAFPDVEILAYDTTLPETWDELVQQEVNDIEQAFEPSVQIDFWNGLTSVEGYRAIRFLNATFYKTPHLGTWDAAFSYHYNRLYAMLSQRLSNWDYAADRVFESPFVWISEGTIRFEAALSTRLRGGAARRGTPLGDGQDVRRLRVRRDRQLRLRTVRAGDARREQARRRGSRAPELEVGSPSRSASNRVDLSGTASDNLAIRYVRWRTDAGTTGVAEMTWVPGVGNPLVGQPGEMEWVASGIPIGEGKHSITVTVEDIKGLSRTKTITARG